MVRLKALIVRSKRELGLVIDTRMETFLWPCSNAHRETKARVNTVWSNLCFIPSYYAWLVLLCDTYMYKLDLWSSPECLFCWPNCFSKTQEKSSRSRSLERRRESRNPFFFPQRWCAAPLLMLECDLLCWNPGCWLEILQISCQFFRTIPTHSCTLIL